eukprot:g17385.t1
MPAPLSSSSSSCLKHRLLGGASLGVMVLAASFAVTSPAMAQAINEAVNTNPATDLTAATDVTDDGDTAKDYGVIDVNTNPTSLTSITLNSDDTIRITDTDIGATGTATLNGAFQINSARNVDVIFAESNVGGIGNDGRFIVTGNLEGVGGGQGGGLDLSVRNAETGSTEQNENFFQVNGNTNLSAVTVTAGNAFTDVGGSDIAVNFGDATTDTFAATTLSVTGGAGAALTGPDAAGGFATVTISGDATTTGAVTVLSGAAGFDAGQDTGGNAHLIFSGNSNTVTLGGALTIRIGDDAADGNSGLAQASFASMTVNANGGVTLFDDGSTSHSAILELNGTGNQTFNGAIDGQAAGDGTVLVNNAGGMVTFNNTIGDGTTIGLVQINGGTNTLFNDNIGTMNFTVGGPGSTLTFNATDASQVVIGNGGAGALTLDDGTINLGSNVGNTDTVFNVGAGVAALPTENAADGGITVNLAANFTTGAIALIDAEDTQDFTAGGGPDVVAAFAVTDTALTDFTVQARGGAADIVEITAAARTATETATLLGVTTNEANALRQAVTSTATSGDTTNLDNLTAALNAGGTQATNAARQVGPQGETLEGGGQVAFSATGQQQGITGDRLSGFRSGDPRFVSAFAATENGFSGGDYSAPYSASAPRYSSSVWFQAFGGVADADADTLIAGYDAAFGGAMIGVDGMVTDNITIGAFGSYTLSSVDGDGVGNAQLDANTYTIGVYAGYTGASFYLDGFASYAGSDNDVTRTAFGQTITGEYDASQFAIGAALGVPIEVSSNVFITPNASLTYNHYDADSYTETGSLGFSATVNPGSASQLTGTLGARFHAVYEDIDGSGTDFIPEVRLGVIGDLVDDDSVSTATFTGGGTAFNVTGTDTDDIGALIGLGLALDNDGWAAGISYDGDIRSDYMSHTARAEFRWKF